ncbi:hypothetical protein VTH82DRAFT_5991 [Thermothelomyces myriococcoides]
MPLGSI